MLRRLLHPWMVDPNTGEWPCRTCDRANRPDTLAPTRAELHRSWHAPVAHALRLLGRSSR